MNDFLLPLHYPIRHIYCCFTRHRGRANKRRHKAFIMGINRQAIKLISSYSADVSMDVFKMKNHCSQYKLRLNK